MYLIIEIIWLKFIIELKGEDDCNKNMNYGKYFIQYHKKKRIKLFNLIIFLVVCVFLLNRLNTYVRKLWSM